MNGKYLFRIDDITWDINYENFCKIRDIFIHYGVKPIVGVIPYNEDKEIKIATADKGISEEYFWSEIKNLQDNYGWSIALHGYNHVYVSDDSGLLKINKRSEFAGLPYDIQYKKIFEGKKALEEHGLKVDIFMAPSHSFDKNTLLALCENNISTVTDGYGLYPYLSRGLLFIPQQIATPRRIILGVFTFCQHINFMTNEDHQFIENFIKKHCKDCISVEEIRAKSWNSLTTQAVNLPGNLLMGPALRLWRTLRDNWREKL